MLLPVFTSLKGWWAQYLNEGHLNGDSLILNHLFGVTKWLTRRFGGYNFSQMCRILIKISVWFERVMYLWFHVVFSPQSSSFKKWLIVDSRLSFSHSLMAEISLAATSWRVWARDSWRRALDDLLNKYILRNIEQRVATSKMAKQSKTKFESGLVENQFWEREWNAKRSSFVGQYCFHTWIWWAIARRCPVKCGSARLRLTKKTKKNSHPIW